VLQAIDYKTGKIKWSHKWEGPGGPRSGVLSTAGNVVFAADPLNNFVALNATTGQPLWHANLGSGMSNAPITFELDGTQYVVVGSGDTLFGFAMHAK
jgi:alcohol dehydrogenase (cytochrome c)